MAGRNTFKKILLCVALVLIVLAVRPAFHLISTYLSDGDTRQAVPSGYTNDASHLNQTRIDSVISIPADPQLAERQVIEILRGAALSGKKISIAGAQHTMGGHTIYPGGIMLNMRGFNKMEIDKENNILHVGSGTMWSDIIPFLDKYEKSVSVMQSNNSFTVGGSISVNCHGWQHNSAPIASTVESLRMVKPDGSVVKCNRQENAELFSLVLGGYGLFGVILDVDLRITDNACYRCERYVFKSEDYVKWFDEKINKTKYTGMAYGRLDITPQNFLNEAILCAFQNQRQNIPPLTDPAMDKLRREVFRGSVGNDYGKELRWTMEKNMGEVLAEHDVSRNQLLNESVSVYENRSNTSVDILHEYFVPKDSVGAFIRQLKIIIPRNKADLLNVTIRNVKEDKDTYLCYANQEVFGFVMLFNQEKTDAGEFKMKKLTQELIDAAIQLGGKYYLPYRLHATREQFYKAYPRAGEFFKMKRKYDPGEIFQNKFYLEYK